MARAGYDPRDMANMFKTIEKQGGSGGPQWLSDHPNPGNRYDYITQGSADAARREPDSRHARLRRRCRRICEQLPPAPTTEAGDEERRRSAADRHVTADDGDVADRPRRAAVVALSAPTTKATCSRSACRRTGARLPGQQRGDVRARRRATAGQRPERVHARRRVRRWRATNRTICRRRPTSSFESLAQRQPRPAAARPAIDRVNVAGRRGLRTVLTNRSDGDRAGRSDRSSSRRSCATATCSTPSASRRATSSRITSASSIASSGRCSCATVGKAF